MTVGVIALLVAGLVYAFWPHPVLVDMAAVTRGSMILTINEEARTRVRDAYVVSAPVSGRLLRVETEPGDRVEKGQTIVGRMLPSGLDSRELEQARFAVAAAEAAVRMAEANGRKADADQVLAKSSMERVVQQRQAGTISQSAVDEARRVTDVSRALQESTVAEINMRQAELADARAAMIGVGVAGDDGEATISIMAPIDGRVLRIMQESDVTLPAGAPIMEIGNVKNDLEVVVELLSTDAVQVNAGNRVIIKGWGGPEDLAGVVERVDPAGFTKFSALGVEEQRVNAIVRFTDDSSRAKLGDGFRVEAHIVIWESADNVIVPSSALFRHGGQWAVFRVEDGTAAIRLVEVVRDNGTVASIEGGLQPDDLVVLYPAAELADGARVASRK